MPKTGRVAVYGTALSGTCIFTEEEGGGKIRGCPRFLALVAGKSRLRLSDAASGRSASIELQQVDKRGNASFRWL
ncbi:hypothetical protein A6U87_13585 [Rhizobium sp. AC44/96]|jgi:hypothetical protein|uniref:hypothetical protein n=1 Tax=unclassified Rhizobium TaxID=2613769 RepID=UPI00080FBD91|nr:MULTISPECIES: hypothetical protein [unclassified Rhizobium]MDM9621846.1 hypothetical protein [Rhizobium sp. S96]OCJ05054.1 hypothetical protein A6U87_13585 [Rhizobium sp. AC44/96]